MPLAAFFILLLLVCRPVDRAVSQNARGFGLGRAKSFITWSHPARIKHRELQAWIADVEGDTKKTQNSVTDIMR